MFKIKNSVKLKMLFASFLLTSFYNSYSSKIKVGASYAPPYYTVEGQNVKGILGDLMTDILSNAGFDPIWKPKPTKRLYNDLINGKIDVYLGALSPAFEGFNESVIHSKFSPVTLELRSYYFGDQPAITKKDELVDKKVLIIRGYTYGGLINYILKPNNCIEYCEVESFDQAVQMLKNRGFEYYLDYKKTGDIYLENHAEPNLKYSTLFNVDLYFMIPKNIPSAENLLSQIEDAFHKVQEKQDI